MNRHLLTLAFVSLCSGALAQDLANAGPASAALPSYDPVLGKCKQVSETPEIADRESGMCVTATRGYVISLQGLPVDAVSQLLADLVVELAVLPESGVQCEEFDDEIAEAIRIAATASADPDQAAQFNEIADTVSDQCGTGRTASIEQGLVPPIGDPNNDASRN